MAKMNRNGKKIHLWCCTGLLFRFKSFRTHGTLEVNICYGIFPFPFADAEQSKIDQVTAGHCDPDDDTTSTKKAVVVKGKVNFS